MQSGQKIPMEYLMQLNKSKIQDFCRDSRYTHVLCDYALPVEIEEYICSLDLPSATEYTYLLRIDSIAVGLLKITWEDGASSAAMHHVQIRRPFRGRGHGKRLLIGSLRTFFEDHDLNIILHVQSTNKIACQLYRKLGFTIIEAIPSTAVKSNPLPEEPLDQ